MDRPADTQQRLEALDPARSFIVQAPAGSGKTGLLVRRFLTLLARVSAPEEILAITFTRKATAEMRARIIAALSHAESDNQSEAGDPEVTDLAKLALENDQLQHWNLLANPSRLKIQTIDAFCYELVRRMPWSSRFGAAPSVLEDPLTGKLYNEAAKRTLDHIEDQRGLSKHCANLIMLLDAHFGTAQSLLSMMLRKRDRWMRGLDMGTRQEFEQMWRQVVEQQLAIVTREIPEELQAEIAFLVKFAGSNPYEKNPNSALISCAAMPAFPGPMVESLNHWRGIATLLLTNQSGRYQPRKQVDVKIGFPPNFKDEKDRMKSVLEFLHQTPECVRALSAIPLLPDAHFSDKQWLVMESLLVLLPVAAAELRLLFKENNQADYIEITQRAEISLGGEDSPSDLALAFDHRINHLLMDEVQDTSLAQIELIMKLTTGWQNNDGRTLFFVGDPMQSIYRFREAEVANFLRIQESGIGEVKPASLTLESNFRSAKSLINWYNQVFTAIFPPIDDVINSAVRYSPSVATRNCFNQTGVILHPELDGTCDSEAEIVCTQVRAEIEQNADVEIGILGRNRSHLVAIAQALRHHGIAFQAIELESLIQRPAIQDLMAITRGLVQLSDRVAWLSILRAPWCGMTLEDISILAMDDHNSTILELAERALIASALSEDGKKRLARTFNAIKGPLARRGRITLRQNVEAVWLSVAGPACVEQTDLADCDSYLKLLETLEKNHDNITASILDNAVTRLWSKTDSRSRVQLLTIHKSKGLEFDVVFLPQLHRRPPTLDRELLRWTRLPEQLLIAVLPHSDAKDDKFYHYLGDLEKLRQHNELHRLLYVACTRARQKLHLHMSVTMDNEDRPKLPSKNSMLGLLWPPLQAEILGNLSDATASVTQHTNTLPLTEFRRLPTNWQFAVAPTGIKLAKVQPHTTSDTAVQIEFSWAGETARITGIAMHKMLQQIDGENWNQWKSRDIESLLSDNRVTLLENGVGRDKQDDAITKMRLAIENLKSDPRADWIFASEHCQVQREWPLTGLLDDAITNIVIDRSFVDPSGIHWIVDFKSSHHEGSDMQWFLKNEKRRYRQQLDRYASVVAMLDDKEIKVGLYFPLLKGWCEWSPELLERL